jgi:hypothetical protein
MLRFASSMIILCTALTTPLMAQDSKPAGVILDQTFKLVSRAKKEAGSYHLKAVTKGEKKTQIEISESISLKIRGKVLSFKSIILYATKPTLTPISASTVTMLNGQKVMVGTVELNAKTYSGKGKIFGPSKQASAPREFARKDRKRPEGLMLFTATIPVFALRLVTKAGEEKKVVSVEFPDDLDEFINIKQNWRLKREAAAADGSFSVGYYRANEKRPSSTYRFDKAGKLLSLSLWGKYEAVLVK